MEARRATIARESLESEIALRFPGVEVVRPPAPLTFAAAANCGLWYAFQDGAEIALLLNDDVTVHADALATLAAAEGKKGPGLFAPEIYPYYGNGERRRFRLDWKKRLIVSEPASGASNGGNGGAPGAPVFLRGRGNGGNGNDAKTNGLHPIDYAEGSAVLISREVFRKTRGFDEDFGLLEVPGAKIWHKGGATAGNGLSPFKAYWRARNAMKFARKHRKHSRPALNAAYHFGGFVIPEAAKAAAGMATGRLKNARVLAALARGTWDTIAG
ncbi:MAG: glycosyltransferase family 2 protein [Planctomycetota bacterium]|jgi:GT2 family glycosyltransferase